MRVRTTWAVVLLLVAALGGAASFHGVTAPLLLGAAVVVPFGVVAAGRAWRLGTALSALVVIVAATAGTWLVLRAADVRVGDAVPRLLTTPRPAPAEVSLLAPLLLAVVLVAAVTASVVLADGVGAALLAPVVAAAVLYTVAQLLSAGAADRHGIAAAALVIIAVGGWSQPYLRGGGRLAWRPVAAVPVALAAVVALGAGALAVSSASFDPRRHVQPPSVRLDTASPLGQLRSWIANPQVRILTAKLTGTDRLHLATLDTFTGADWQVDARYQQLGLPTGDALPPARRTQPARATVRLDRLGGLWLPGVGTATAASLDDVLVDPDDGTLARPGRVAPGLDYDLEGRVEVPTREQLSVAAVPVRVPARYLALPDAPVAFGTYARAAVRGASTPFEEAVALENAVTTDRRLDPKAASGSSYGRLSTFLFGRPGTPGAGAGTAEQFAAAFAVLARAVGLPTRLTVGFDVASNRTTVVHGRDATVWPEVYLGDAGWVAFAPTPGTDDAGAGGALRDSVLQRLSQRPDEETVVPPVITPGTPTPGRPAAAAHPAGAHGANGSMPVWLLVLLVVVAVLVVLAVLVALLRARRTRRHRDRGARGAWAEIVDLLVLVGRRPGVQQPAPQIAAEADDVLGAAAAIVAAAAEREAFAPGAVSTPPLWGHVRTVRRRAGATLPLRRRVLLPLDPRPLLRR